MFKLKLETIQSAGTDLFHLIFQAPAEVMESYKVPGQFLVLQDGDSKGYFALAMRPGSEKLELLVKNEGDLAQKLCALKPGATVDSTEAQGPGFPLEKAKDRNLHIFSMGSAISAFRGIMHGFRAKEYTFANLTLWQGAFTRRHLPFSKEYPQWGLAGATIHVCVDMEVGSSGNIWQTMAQKKPDFSDAVCFWAGSEAFGKDIFRSGEPLGIKRDDFHTNV